MITPRVRRNHSSAILLFLVLALGSLSCLSVSARAKDDSDSKKSHEKPYGLIFGTVWGPDDRPVFGVSVKVRRAREKKARWELNSDHNGEFARSAYRLGGKTTWSGLIRKVLSYCQESSCTLSRTLRYTSKTMSVPTSGCI